MMADPMAPEVDEDERLENLNVETKLRYERMVENRLKITQSELHSCIFIEAK